MDCGSCYEVVLEILDSSTSPKCYATNLTITSFGIFDLDLSTLKLFFQTDSVSEKFNHTLLNADLVLNRIPNS